MSKIPITVRIGVTGHRVLSCEDLLNESVGKVLARLDRLLEHSPHTYVAVSPLAEGADRLVAKRVLGWQSNNCEPSELDSPLPMPADEYAKDFLTSESKAEFRELLARAVHSQALETDAEKFNRNDNDSAEVQNQKKEARRQSYRNVGFWVVDNCDILIAIWNGDKAKGVGGTAEIVEYALGVGRPVVWIHSETGEINSERFGSRLLNALKHHDAYNAENLTESQIASEVDRRFARLKKASG